MNVLDLFSGIGGFSLGLESVGYHTQMFCEIDEDARWVLRNHWPDIPIHDDVRTLTGDMVGPVDVITGGFPCQDISKANIGGEGLSGERSGLWSEFLRLIEELEPSYVVIENVAALRSRGLAAVLKDLWTVGYDAEWHILPASAFGYPHQRERLWIVSYPAHIGIQEPLLERCRPQPSKPEIAGLSDGWVSERFESWIRSRVVQSGDGLSRRLASKALKQYGNAVVPKIPAYIGTAINQYEESRNGHNA